MNSSTTEVTPGDCEPSYQTRSIAKVVVIIAIFVLGVSGNSVLVVLVSKAKKLHKQMCYVIANIAIADIMVLSLGLRQWLNFLLSNSRSFKVGGILGSAACKVNTLLQLAAPIVSITSMILISFERLRAISSTVRLKPLKPRWFACLLAVTWLLPIAVYSYTLYAFDIVSVNGKEYCIDVNIDRNGWILYHYAFYAILVALFAMLVTLNVLVVKKLRSSQGSICLPQIEMKKRELKFARAVRLVSCCSAVFIVSWGPRSCLKFLDHLLIFRFDSCSELYFVIEILFFLGFVFSPLIYFVFLPDFRDAFKDSLRKWPGRRDSERRKISKQSNTTTL